VITRGNNRQQWEVKLRELRSEIIEHYSNRNDWESQNRKPDPSSLGQRFFAALTSSIIDCDAKMRGPWFGQRAEIARLTRKIDRINKINRMKSGRVRLFVIPDPVHLVNPVWIS